VQEEVVSCIQTPGPFNTRVAARIECSPLAVPVESLQDKYVRQRNRPREHAIDEPTHTIPPLIDGDERYDGRQ
jgi:hypothetical protein